MSPSLLGSNIYIVTLSKRQEVHQNHARSAMKPMIQKPRVCVNAWLRGLWYEKNVSRILSYLEVGVEKDINAHTRAGVRIMRALIHG